MKKLIVIVALISLTTTLSAQTVIPFDTTNWNIKAMAHVKEVYRGTPALYLQNGSAVLKNTTFLNGTIEFDVFLTERHGFPGVYFRTSGGGNEESFYLRPHLSGKPDANHALPAIKGIVPWQLYCGPAYSFSYEYNYDDWTHIKLVVKDDKAQVFLDHSEKPQLSWYLKHDPTKGRVSIGGSGSPMHYANFTIDHSTPTLVDFKAERPKMIEGVIENWSISDMFTESTLQHLDSIPYAIDNRKWEHTVESEDIGVANISRAILLYDGSPGNTVFAKVTINADSDQTKLFHFGYSDRVVVLLNGDPIYFGNNKWRSRDYRYLGTIGLFDGVYLNLKKGENTLMLAVSEDFGGWGVMGKFEDYDGIKVVP